jgi:phosphohistidine phosphatase
MEFCFLRHGEADWADWDKPDNERPLTKRGRKEVKRVSKLLARLKLSPDAILSSPLPRACETAQMTAKSLDVAVTLEPELAKEFTLDWLRRIIGKTGAECIVLVGHEPAFSHVIKELTGGEVKLAKAGVALVEVNADGKGGKLLWLFPPKMAKAGK